MKHSLHGKLNELKNSTDFIENAKLATQLIEDLIVEIEEIDERFDMLESRISEIEYKTLLLFVS